MIQTFSPDLYFLFSSGGCELNFGHENRSTFPLTRSIKPRLSTIKSNSVEFDDQEPWEEGVNSDSSACKFTKL